MSYDKLVAALRECDERFFCNDCPIFETCDGYIDRAMHDAAAAIEALQYEIRESMQKCAECGENEPKRGEWIKHPEVKNIYGGVYIECPFCGEKYVVQYVSDEKFCRNCGADMRAKTEVQDGK